jgi:hypothetical protein
MTATASAAMTATAGVQPTPTATPVPLPTATPAPLTVNGAIASTDAGKRQISVVPAGSTAGPSTYALAKSAVIVRDGLPAALDTISAGDSAVLTVDGTSHQVTRLTLEPAVKDSKKQIEPWWLVLVGLTGLILVKRRRTPEPFVLKRKSS